MNKGFVTGPGHKPPATSLQPPAVGPGAVGNPVPWGCRGQAWGPRPAPPSSCPGAGDRGPDGAPISRLVLLGVSLPLPLAWGASFLPSAHRGKQPPPKVLLRGGLSPHWPSIPRLLERGSAVSRVVGPRGLARPGCLACSSPSPLPCSGWHPTAPQACCPLWLQISPVHGRCPWAPLVPSSTSEQAPASTPSLLRHREAGGRPGDGRPARPHVQPPSAGPSGPGPSLPPPTPPPPALRALARRPRPVYSQAAPAASESWHQGPLLLKPGPRGVHSPWGETGSQESTVPPPSTALRPPQPCPAPGQALPLPWKRRDVRVSERTLTPRRSRPAALPAPQSGGGGEPPPSGWRRADPGRVSVLWFWVLPLAAPEPLPQPGFTSPSGCRLRFAAH